MKSILLIEDNINEFTKYSDLFSKKGFSVYPAISSPNGKVTEKMLTQILGIRSTARNPKDNEKSIINNMKIAIFKYIIDNELYSKVNAIILDINLTAREDTIGLNFLDEFRRDFKAPESNYSYWNSIVPVIALTSYDKEKHEEVFKEHSGCLLGYFHKPEVISNPKAFLESVSNFCDQMNTINRFFNNKEFSIVIKMLNTTSINIEELMILSRLTLLSSIANMDRKKRKAFFEKFSHNLTTHINEINGFRSDIENIEEKFGERIKNVYNSSSFTTLNLFLTFANAIKDYVKPELFETIIKYVSEMSNSLLNM
jgi:CheY-like chemotaxis protein